MILFYTLILTRVMLQATTWLVVSYQYLLETGLAAKTRICVETQDWRSWGRWGVKDSTPDLQLVLYPGQEGCWEVWRR